MKKLFLLLSIVGFAIPNYFAINETIASGNFLLWTSPFDTMSKIFENNIVATFSSDLLIACLAFLIWTFTDSKRNSIPQINLLRIATLIFGMSGTLPLYLYFRKDD